LSEAQKNEVIVPVSRLRETALTALAAGVVLLFCVALLVWDPNFFWIDDAQSGALPGYCEMARAWRSGEVPLLSQYSWRAGALGAEYSAGVFSPSLTLSILLVFAFDLPLPLAAAGIAILHLLVLAAGSFRLARQRGLELDLALLVTLVASLNGWIILWGARNWGVCLYSFAWLPWVWWGLEYARQKGGRFIRFIPAGLFLYLLIAAGWPLTVLMAAVITLWLGARGLFEERRWGALWPLGAAWVVGLGLSAPAWMMLLEYAPHTVRGDTPLYVRYNGWIVPWSALPGLVFPALISVWNVYGFWKPHQSTELCGGLVPLAMLAAALMCGWRPLVRALRWEWALLAAVFVLTTSPSMGNFRWPFRWLPLFFLVLALVAAQTFSLLRARAASSPGGENENRKDGPATSATWIPRVGGWAVLLFVAVWLRAVVVGADPTLTTWNLGYTLLALCLAWSFAEKYFPRACGWSCWVPVTVVAVSAWLTYAGTEAFVEVPIWQIDDRIREPAPLDRNVRYLSVSLEQDIHVCDGFSLPCRAAGVGPGLCPGNTSMYSGVELINGYSPFGLRGMEEVFEFGFHGYLMPKGADRILAKELGPHGLLELTGTDGLILADRFTDYRDALIREGWHEIATVEGGTVFHRDGPRSPRVRAVERAEVVTDRAEAVRRIRERQAGTPVPMLLLNESEAAKPRIDRFAPARVTLVQNERLSAVADVASDPGRGEILVVFSRPWYPGYKATCNGLPVPVEICDLILPAVRLPAGTNGRIELYYQPHALVRGCQVAGGILLAILFAVVVTRFVKRRQPRNSQTRRLGYLASARTQAAQPICTEALSS
jgi:hypothetical protein